MLGAKNRRGFTLIELVIVVAIMLIIASIVLVAMNKSRAKARDQQRIADLDTISQAMSLYYAQNRSYPFWEVSSNKKGIFNRSNVVQCPNDTPCIYDAAAGSTWRDFVDNYLTSKPISPKRGLDWQYYYYSQLDSATPPEHYAVMVNLEGANYTANKLSNDKWYSTGYCKGAECASLPNKGDNSWYYVVGN